MRCSTAYSPSRYKVLGFGEVDGKFVKFLEQPIVDFTGSTPLSAEERASYMKAMGFEPINKENTAFSDRTLVVADLQGNNVVRDKAGNIRVIDADVKLHTRDTGGDYIYPDVEADTEQRLTDTEQAEHDQRLSLKEQKEELRSIVEKAKADGTYMKAPNGKQSNLNEHQWAQVRTKAFKNWFGDWENDPENASKVVDENGEPRVMYHQTNSTVWVNRKTGENYEDLDWKAKDYWQNEATDEEWDNTWQERDFYTFDNKTHGRRSIEMPAFFFSPRYDEYHEYGDRTIAAFLNIKNPAINPDIENAGVYDDAGEKAMQKLIDAGHDGFIREYDGTIDEINAFYPNQIKSATENEGGFNPSNDDIRYSLRGGRSTVGHTPDAAVSEAYENAVKDTRGKTLVGALATSLWTAEQMFLYCQCLSERF